MEKKNARLLTGFTVLGLSLSLLLVGCGANSGAQQAANTNAAAKASVKAADPQPSDPKEIVQRMANDIGQKNYADIYNYVEPSERQKVSLNDFKKMFAGITNAKVIGFKYDKQQGQNWIGMGLMQYTDLKNKTIDSINGYAFVHNGQQWYEIINQQDLDQQQQQMEHDMEMTQQQLQQSDEEFKRFMEQAQRDQQQFMQDSQAAHDQAVQDAQSAAHQSMNQAQQDAQNAAQQANDQAQQSMPGQ